MLDLVIKNSRLIGKNGEYNIGVDEGKIKEITKENCSDIQKRIIDLIKENPKITVSQMSNALDITID